MLSTSHTHDLSYILKTDGESNLVAIFEQCPTVIIPVTLDNMDEKVEKAILQHFERHPANHNAIIEDPSPKFEDSGIGINVGKKHIKVKC